jgi:hypothetical protein
MSATSSPAGTDSAVIIEEPLSYIEELKRLPKVSFYGKEEKREIYKHALDHIQLVVKECLSCGYVTKKGYFISTNPKFHIKVSLTSGWGWDLKEKSFMRPADFDLFGLWWMTHKSATRQNAVREFEEFLSGDMEKLEQEQAQRELEWSHQLKDLIYPALLAEGRSRRRGSASQLRKLVEEYYGEEFPPSEFRRCLQGWVASGDQYRFSVTCLTRKNNNHTFTLVNNFDL